LVVVPDAALNSKEMQVVRARHCAAHADNVRPENWPCSLAPSHPFPAIHQTSTRGGGDGGGGDVGGNGGGGEGGGDGHHVRIIETSGAVVLGRPTPSRTASSSAGLRATSHTNRSFIWPVNIGSLITPKLLFPTYRLERPTGNGKRIDAVYATLTPFQKIWAGP
jgi:hypothetical protein